MLLFMNMRPIAFSVTLKPLASELQCKDIVKPSSHLLHNVAARTKHVALRRVAKLNGNLLTFRIC